MLRAELENKKSKATMMSLNKETEALWQDLKNKISFVQKVIDDKIKEISFEIVIPFVAPVIVESVVVPYDQIEVTPRDINEVIELNRGLPVGSLSE